MNTLLSYNIQFSLPGGHSKSPSLADDRSLENSYIQQDQVIIDIYGAAKSDIQECKKLLEKNLEKAMTTLEWKNKPTYQDDKELIKKLSKERVS